MSCCSPEDKSEKTRNIVKERYAAVAKESSSCCGPVSNTCCGPTSSAVEIGKKIGYSDSDLTSVPDGANLGLGCGNPTAIDALMAEEVVLDLGAGAGMDAFIAAKKVGQKGKVIGVDMTPEMVEKAKKNAKKTGVTNVDFRLGQIESLPVDSETVDVIISNCVINLSPEKEKVFAEAYRVLKPGGRLMVSDIVLEGELPPSIKESVDAYVGCIAGASKRDDYLGMIKSAGFEDITIESNVSFAGAVSKNDPFVVEAMENLGVTIAEVKDSLEIVRSIGVFAKKGSR